jgi:hypothetical protein
MVIYTPNKKGIHYLQEVETTVKAVLTKKKPLMFYNLALCLYQYKEAGGGGG